MKRFRVRRATTLHGQVRVPGDKSVSHRALIFGSLAEGESVVHGMSHGLDNRATADAFRAMGVPITLESGTARIQGVGLDGLRGSTSSFDCGNSGTTMRLLAGLLAGQRFSSHLTGDESLTRRPMGRVIHPLRARGAHIGGSSGRKENELYPPLSIAPLVENETLSGIEYEMPVASAQVKSCLLLSGLYSKGLTALREPVLSRDHTERIMLALGVPLQTVGPMVVLNPQGWNRRWSAFHWQVPGDISSAAFFLAAAGMVPNSEIMLHGVGVNPTRTGLLEVLHQMGLRLEINPQGDGNCGEPTGDIQTRFSQVHGVRVGGETVTRMIDEVPALCAIAAVAKGRTEITDAHELRVKESDRIATMIEVLRAFGVSCEELPDGIHIEGGQPLRAAHVKSYGDHRIAMSSALLGLMAEGETLVDDVDCVDTSFPTFVSSFRGLGADITVEEVA